MNNPHQALIEEKVAEIMTNIPKMQVVVSVGDGENDIVDLTEVLPYELTQILQDTIDTLLEEERIQLHKLIKKEAEATYAEMLKAVLRQNGLPEGGHALMNTDMMHHIVTGCVGNLSTRLNKALDKTPPNKV